MPASKYKILATLSALWLLCAAYFNACDLPRDNPLDPDAYNYGAAEPVIPELPLMQLSSYHSSQWFPAEDIFTLEITVSGEQAVLADSVHFIYNDTLYNNLNKSGSLWRLPLETSLLPVENIFDLIGVYFRSTVYFNDGDSTITNEACLYRIIEPVPLTDHPSGNEAVSSSPVFTWLSSEIYFTYNYALTINHISTSGFVTLVANIQNLPADSLSYDYPGSLSAGNYYWTISIVDVFNNISRSKEAAFTVTP